MRTKKQAQRRRADKDNSDRLDQGCVASLHADWAYGLRFRFKGEKAGLGNRLQSLKRP
jgi:hypothetical protein